MQIGGVGRGNLIFNTHSSLTLEITVVYNISYSFMDYYIQLIDCNENKVTLLLK